MERKKAGWQEKRDRENKLKVGGRDERKEGKAKKKL